VTQVVPAKVLDAVAQQRQFILVELLADADGTVAPMAATRSSSRRS
jgi:hypothetical protein